LSIVEDGVIAFRPHSCDAAVLQAQMANLPGNVVKGVSNEHIVDSQQ
jgi:hypothetical protein